MDVWVLDSDSTVMMVYDGEGTIDPEEWVRDHGARNYPKAIYFFGTLESI